MQPFCSFLAAVGLITVAWSPVFAQRGGFVATLGTDTLHVEQFTRFADRIEGTIVTRSPVTRVARYTLWLDRDRIPVRYEVRTSRGDGTPEAAPGLHGWLTLSGDTLLRETPGATKPDTQRIPVKQRVTPGPGLPYLGVSFLMYEFALREALRRADSTGLSSISLLTMNPRQVTAPVTRAWFIGTDSAEIDYFGVARSGYRFRNGLLIRADWTGTTYRYRVTRVDAIDVDARARDWHAADLRSGAVGALSPRDTARGSIGTATAMVDYSRPSKRGRRVWGEVVPWGKVWRLGADVATHIVFSADVRVGGVDVPAGTYTLWMLPQETGESQLIISKLTRVFGTQYNPTQDLARIALRRDEARGVIERVTIDFADGRLWIRWDNVVWSTSVEAKPGLR